MPNPIPPLIVVDAANVVGSRPDGWWRDRAAAAARLLEQLRGAVADDGADMVVVLEGRARAAAEPGRSEDVTVVHAPRSGDDEIVDVVAAAVEAPGRAVIVVTADRGLRQRVEELGARAHGPTWLWHRLDPRT